ncbi:hypothetical protein FQR65_LT08852 [Abscondita terminalis]|nr:hypothetical protein FQR65_LT08852 [Abscondita terminalis]
MYLIVAVPIILLCIFKLYVEKKYSYWKKCDVPFPTPSFLVGNVGKAFLLKESISDVFLDLYRQYEGYAYVGFYNFLSPALVLRDPELINNVLIKNFENFQDTSIRTADPIAGVNAFFTGGEQWKRLRKQISPQLSSVKMKYMYVHIENVCKQLIHYVKESKQSVNLEKMAFTFTGDNVMSCAYGLSNQSFLNNSSVMLEVNRQFNRNLSVANMNHTIGFFFPTFSKLFKISYLGRQTPKLLADTIKMGLDQRISSKNEQNDFVDFLIKLKLTNGTIKDTLTCSSYFIADKSYLSHGVAFYLDGFETSGTTFTYLLLEIACNRNVQNTATKQVIEVYKKYGTIYSSDAVKDLVYLENAVLGKIVIIRH